MAEKTKKLEAELFQVKAQLEWTSSAKLDEMLSFQKFTSNQTGLKYDFSSSNISSSYNVEFENNDVKTILASENIDKGKSILGAPSKLKKKKRLKTLGLRRTIIKSLNRRSSIFVITMELLDVLDLITISG